MSLSPTDLSTPRHPAHTAHSPLFNLQYHLLAIILFVYLALAGLFAITTPAWQNPDEPAHYNYVAYIARERRLPVLGLGDYDQAYLQRLKDEKFPPELPVDNVRYEFHQPPLYYVLAAPVFWLSGGNLLALRLYSALLGAGVVALIFLCTRTIFPERPAVVLGATAFVALLPMHIAILASVNNDALAELLIAAGVLVLLRWVKWGDRGAEQKAKGTGQKAKGAGQKAKVGAGPRARPQAKGKGQKRTHHAPRTTPHLVTLGVLIGLGFLTKATAYILLPVAVLTVAAIATQSSDHPTIPSPPHLVTLSSLLLPALLLGLPLWVRNIALYGGLDFLGLKWHDQVVTGQPTTAAWIAQHGWIAYGERAGGFTFKSFWGVFGWLGVFMDGRVYTLLLIATVVAAGGCVAGAWSIARNRAHLSHFQRTALAILGFLGLGVFASYVWYNLGFIQHQGRYLFPALSTWSLLFALGWKRALRPRSSRWIGGFLLLGAVLEAGAGLATGALDQWTLLLLGSAAGGLWLNGFILPRLPGNGRLRSLLYVAPFVFLGLLDVAVPFLYIIPQLG